MISLGAVQLRRTSKNAYEIRPKPWTESPPKPSSYVKTLSPLWITEDAHTKTLTDPSTFQVQDCLSLPESSEAAHLSNVHDAWGREQKVATTHGFMA